MRFTVSFSLLLASLTLAHASDWPMFRGPDLTGVSRETGWNSTWPKEGPKVAWRAQIGLGFSTVAVAQGMPMHASISAAKGAVEGLAKGLAAKWAPAIRVNVIAPSLTDTPLAGALLNSDLKKEAAAKRHPLQQVGRSEDMAALVTHLLSGHARFMTGQVLHVDGGLSSVRTF